MQMEQGMYCANCIAPNTESLFSITICKQLKSLQVVNCKIKVVHYTNRVRQTSYTSSSCLLISTVYNVKNYESWLAVDIIIAIIRPYFLSGPHCIFISQFTDLEN